VRTLARVMVAAARARDDTQDFAAPRRETAARSLDLRRYYRSQAAIMSL
jgi:hypothetical protein